MHVGEDPLGVGELLLAPHESEERVPLDRTSVQEHVAALFRLFDFRENAGQRKAAGPRQDESHGAILAVFGDQDHGLREVRISKIPLGDEQLARRHCEGTCGEGKEDPGCEVGRHFGSVYSVRRQLARSKAVRTRSKWSLAEPISEAYGTSGNGRARRVLLLGFGGLLALLIALGSVAAITLRRVAAADAGRTRDYLVRRQALSDTRQAIFAAGGYLREYLLDPEEPRYATHREPARKAANDARKALERYQHAPGPPVSTLRAAEGMEAFTRMTERALETAGEERRRTGYSMLAGEIAPARERLLALLEELARGEQAVLNQTVAGNAAALGQLQDRLSLAVTLAVVAGAILAVFVYRYLARLEAIAQARLAQFREAATRSEQLSHRLLTVQEQERKSLARELHDEVGQSLGALLVDIGQARNELDVNPWESRVRLEAAIATGKHTLETVRDISLLLRPSMLDELGLIPALHWQAREVSRRSGMVVTVRSAYEDLDLNEEYRTTVFRVVQEALANASKHAAAATALVEITTAPGRLHITVSDNGKGFDADRTRGLGLLGMEERAVRLGGRLHVSSTPGRGTVVTVDLPLELENPG